MPKIGFYFKCKNVNMKQVNTAKYDTLTCFIYSFKILANLCQGGQSRGQHDWVHGFPEPVKSFITFVILSQFSCDKVQKPPHNFLHKTVSKFLLGLL